MLMVLLIGGLLTSALLSYLVPPLLLAGGAAEWIAYRFRRRLGIERLFEAAVETTDASVFD